MRLKSYFAENGRKNSRNLREFQGKSYFERSHFACIKTQPQHLRNRRHNGERIGVRLLHDTAERRHLSAADYAEEHRAVLFRIHALGGLCRHAAAELLHKRASHFLGFVGDDTELDRRLKTVRQRVVRFAFDVRFERGHHNGEQGRRGGVAAEYEYGATDDDAIDDEQHPRDRTCGEFTLDHNGENIRAARTAADLECEADRHADTDTRRDRREDLFAARAEFDLERRQSVFEEQEPESLQADIRRREERELFLDEKER